MGIRVLGGNVSPFVRKVRVFCAEKGIGYEHVQINPFSPPEGWRAISPLGRIPALDHDGRIVNDSSVICAYLERIHPEPGLFPKDAYEYARAAWLEEYVDGGVVPISGGQVFQPVVLTPLFGGKPGPEPAALEKAEKVVAEQVAPLFDYLEAQLGGEPFFVGNRLSIADIAVASVFVNLRHAGFPPDAARIPRLAAFVERMHARPSFKACIEEERPVFGKRWR